MALPCLASLFYFVILSGTVAAHLIYVSIKLFTLVWPLIACRYLLRSKVWTIHLSDARHREALVTGLFIGLFIVIGMLVLMDTALGTAVRRSSEMVRGKVIEIGIMQYYWSFGLFLAVFHSLIEEYYWRWFVYGQLRNICRPGTAHLAAAVAFASHHLVVLWQFFPPTIALLFGAGVCAGGVLWSVMYEREKTLAGVWLSHILVDLGILAVGYDLISA